jgi:LmbE family N-acetylglucosaminyl deacetylase
MPHTWSDQPGLVVVAHPDDETIGAGSLLPDLAEVHLLYVTDGAPRNPSDAASAGCATRADYARVRRAELEAALALAGIGPERTLTMDLVDQEAMLHLDTIARRIAGLIRELRPAWVLTHPYEGGHPDHDACACGVHTACRWLERPPGIYEFAGYHGREGGMVTGEFLPNGGGVTELRLSDASCRLKRAMFDCYASQKHMLRNFSIEVERFRPAPEYDFTRPPHAGTLLYERFGWASGERFRALARHQCV